MVPKTKITKAKGSLLQADKTNSTQSIFITVTVRLQLQLQYRI